MIGLLARAALRVDRRAGDAELLAECEPGVARDVVRLLARLRDAAADDLLDLGRVEAGVRHHRRLDRGEQMGRMEGASAPLDPCLPLPIGVRAPR